MNSVIVLAVLRVAEDFPDFEAAMPDETLFFTLTGSEGETLNRLATGQQISLLAKKLRLSFEYDNYKKVLQ